MNVLVVESPSKAKSINKYLGDDYKVLASIGHVRDLSAKNDAIDTDNNFEMKWETSDRGKKVMKEIADGEWTRFTVRAESGTDVRESVVALAVANKWPLREIHTHGASLEDVFVELTQSPHTA